ncbi:MAG: hypothetical protein Q8R30_05655 [bacterium]|nr:hypothetical protein [bacterium]
MKRPLSFTHNSAMRITAATFSVAAVIVPLSVSAASKINEILTNAQNTLNIVLRILMTFAVVIFIWGIVRMIAAAGNAAAVKQAKGILLWGIIGIAVMASMTGIVALLQTYFGVSGGDTITVPQF